MHVPLGAASPSDSASSPSGWQAVPHPPPPQPPPPPPFAVGGIAPAPVARDLPRPACAATVSILLLRRRDGEFAVLPAPLRNARPSSRHSQHAIAWMTYNIYYSVLTPQLGSPLARRPRKTDVNNLF
jgi:hypothetical protein